MLQRPLLRTWRPRVTLSGTSTTVSSTSCTAWATGSCSCTSCSARATRTACSSPRRRPAASSSSPCRSAQSYWLFIVCFRSSHCRSAQLYWLFIVCFHSSHCWSAQLYWLFIVCCCFFVVDFFFFLLNVEYDNSKQAQQQIPFSSMTFELMRIIICLLLINYLLLILFGFHSSHCKSYSHIVYCFLVYENVPASAPQLV